MGGGDDFEEDWELLEKRLDDKQADAGGGKPPGGEVGDDDRRRREQRDRDRRDRDGRDRHNRGDRRDRRGYSRDGGRRDTKRRDRSRDGGDRRGRGVRGRSRSRSRSRSPSHRSTTTAPRTSEEREAERRRRAEERELEQKKRELEKLDRDTRTVFAYNLSTKADEREIYQFFSQVGVVQDVRIIYDRNTPRSKGMAYVEFADKEAVSAALATTGQVLRNQVVMVKSSEAEKNIAWEAAQAQKQAEAANQGQNPPAAAAAGVGGLGGGVGVGGFGGIGGVAAGPCKLHVGGLHVNISEEDLEAVFEPFGETNFITVQRDAATGTSLGSGYVQYKQTQHALLAISQLNGLELVGQSLRVSMAPGGNPDAHAPAQGAGVTAATAAAPAAAVMSAASLSLQSAATVSAGGADRLDEDSEGLKMDAWSRAALMARLAGQDVSGVLTGGIDPVTGRPITAEEMAAAAAPQMPVAAQPITQGVLGPGSPIPTPCLLLKNLFDPASETEDEWWVEIAEDVKDECSKHGRVLHVHVDRESPTGFVYLKFEAVEGSQRAQQALHSRWFAGRMIAAEYQFTVLYDAHFGLR